MRLRRPEWTAPARGSALRWTAPGVLAFSVLRLPSFFEPHWYTDEASYVSVARSLLQGRVLYSQIWNNKPPLQSWTIAAVVRVFGPSEVGLHLLTFLSGLAAVAAVAFAATRILGVQRACVATLVCGIVLGLPILDAELALPESLLIAPIAWAGALILVRVDPRRETSAPRRVPVWPFVVGALVAAGIAYQQTVVAEASAFGLIIALSPRTRWRELVAYVGTVVVITAAWVSVAIATAGAARVAFALVGFYIPYTRSALPSGDAAVLAHVAEVGGAALLLCVGAFLCRRLRTPSWAVMLWAGAALLVAAMAGQPYAHYLTAAVAPVSLAVAALPLPGRLLHLNRDALKLLPAVAALGIAAALARATGLDWIPEAEPSPAQNSTRTLTQYYGGAVRSALQGDDDAWADEFDSHVPADAAVVSWISQHGYVGASAVVWSSDSWVYSLADLPVLMPTPPIYNDEVLLGHNGPVAAAVEALNPTLIIVSHDAENHWPEIGPLLAGGAYQLVFGSGPISIWLRHGS